MITYEKVKGPALKALGQRNAEPVRAVKVPFDLWAEACGGRGGGLGLAYKWHVLAAGKSGEGKTYLALNVAAHAIAAGEVVTFHSLEMDWDELATRVMGIVSGVSTWKLNPGKHHSVEHFAEAERAMNRARGDLYTNREPMWKLSDLLDGIRRHAEMGSRLHIVDYLQLAWTGDAESQTARITEVSHAVRQIAKELQIVTFCLSQFNRDTSKDRDTKPQKEGMIGGSALENDADQVLLLDHSRKENATDAYGRKTGWDGWLVLDKNRHGPSTELPIRYVAESGRMRQRLDDEIRESERRKS